MNTPTYRAVHQHIRRLRGPASSHPCTTCGQPAHEWALQSHANGLPTDERGRRYTTNLDAYAPMCRTCHAAHDQAPTCRRGLHPMPESLTWNGGKPSCRECKRETNRRWYEQHRARIGRPAGPEHGPRRPAQPAEPESER